MKDPSFRLVYRSVNKPLTVLSAERRLFFVAAILGAATFTAFNSFWGGLFMWCSLYLLARWMTVYDPQILRVLLNSTKFRKQYDPAKHAYTEVILGQSRPRL